MKSIGIDRGRIGEESGLSSSEAAARLVEYGENRLPESGADGFFVIFLRQFRSPLVSILSVVGILTFFVGEYTDAVVIIFVLLFNAVVGTIQEGKAQDTLRALRKYAETNATVLRDGAEKIVPDTKVVPGDIVILQEGEKIPADARLILAYSFKVNEASLTGESTPVHKFVEDGGDSPGKDDGVRGSRNLVFKGTNAVSGSAVAVVTQTGVRTVIGGIAAQIAGPGSEVPLKREIARLSNSIVVAVIALSVALFGIGIATGRPIMEMAATVVALAVSVIPEGLPIVVTLVLAAGVFRMSRRNALVKRLHAVEALGAAHVIAVDKTGTLTKNEMIVERAYLPAVSAGRSGRGFVVTGSGYAPEGDIVSGGKIIDAANHPDLGLLGKLSMFCAGARVAFSEETGTYRVAGDPTEAAMEIFSRKVGFRREHLLRESEIVSEFPFDYSLKLHAVSFRDAGGSVSVAVTGAPEAILGRVVSVRTVSGTRKLGKREREALSSEFLSLSNEGLRVVAIAIGEADDAPLSEDSFSGLSFVGFLAMKDDLRPEVAESVRRARKAGIRVVMITGDFRVTAEAIAKEAGIFRPGDGTLSGAELDALSDAELRKMLPEISVFARVTPEHKLRIIEAYRSLGNIVAMTGDGVNDAPSLVAADLGIAMGVIGTEVAKEAADIVLLDDDFGSIISAVEEGRNIYRSVRRVVLYLFSTSLGEVGTIVGAMLFGLPIPVLPAQIIWLNLVTDGFLDISLGMESAEKRLSLKRLSENGKRRIVDPGTVVRMVLMGGTMAIGTLLLFRYELVTDPAKAGTVAFTVLAVYQWVNALGCRRDLGSVFRLNPFSNRFLVGAFAIVVPLQLLAVYHPFFRKFLHTVPLDVSDWGLIVAVSLSVLLVEEARKAVVLFARKAFSR